ncbi:hypothetical protein [Pseudomonas soli]|uniref:hypothetical protein n=1 Tax=Pseudomonas soli TaxID=1306993 RepID=UPI0003C7D87C|nr:hypothetical protein O165_022285 [Pseudomonas soli]
MKQGVSDYQRSRIIELRRRHSFREVAQMTGVPLGTVKTIISRSGAFRDNPVQRALFTLPPMQITAGTSPAVQELPKQQAVTGDRDVDALLWLREVVSTGHPTHIDAAMEAAKRIKTPFKELELRYRSWLQAKHPNNMFAALSSFDLGNLESLAKSSVQKLARQTEARARFGDRVFSLTDAELFCESALDGLEPWDGFDLNKAEVAARFRARPEQMPNTLSDCIHELQYWNDLYWLRNACEQYAGDPAPEASARDWFVFELLAEIRPRHKDEAKAVIRYLSISGRADHRQDCDRIIDNLIG